MNAVTVDTHTHTIYCGHASAEMTVANSVAAAEAAGLSALAITEHLHSPNDRGRLDRILADLRRCQPALDVYVGAEIDADPYAADGSLVTGRDDLAYVIASTHHYPETGHWWYDTLELSADERRHVVARWGDWAAAIVANPAVDTLAHPGILISKNGLTEDFSGPVLDVFRQVFAAAAANQTLIELNELAAKKFTEAHRATYHLVVQAAVEAGCQIVLASDAHKPENIARFEWTLTVMEQVGLGFGDLALPTWRTAPHQVGRT